MIKMIQKVGFSYLYLLGIWSFSGKISIGWNLNNIIVAAIYLWLKCVFNIRMNVYKVKEALCL